MLLVHEEGDLRVQRNLTTICISLALGAAIAIESIPARAAAPGNVVVAVFPIEDTTGKLPAESIGSLSHYLTARLGDIPGLSIVPSAELSQRLATEKAESYKACYDSSCQIEIGKEVAASKVTSSRLTAIDDECILTTFVFDLARAATDATASVRSKCEGGALVAAIDEITARLRTALTQGRTEKSFSSLLVRTSPAGAEVTLDALPTGLVTPAEFPSVAAGEHRVRVDTERAFGERTVSLKPGEMLTVDVELAPRPCALAITTEPVGAALSVDGRVLGFAPTEVEVPCGVVEVIARAAGPLESRTRVVAKPARKATPVHLQLDPGTAGSAAAEVKKDKGVRWGWLIAAVVIAGGGVALDIAPSSASNGRMDALDLAPPAIYVAAGVSGLIGFWPTF